MRIWRIGERVCRIAVVALILASVAEVIFFVALRNGGSLYSARDSFPVPSGYLLDSKFMPAKAARCYLIRISSDTCPYCRLDQGRYIQVVQEAQRTGCETIILAPVSGEMKLDRKAPACNCSM